MKVEELEGIGLTRSEIIVYITLLKIGTSSTGGIVKKAKISSGKIYEILDKLIEKGLVSYILKNNVKFFSASEPYKIKDYIDKKKIEIEQKAKKIEKILPELKALKKSTEEEYSAEIHTGIDGFKTSLMSLVDNMPDNSELLFLGGSGVRKPTINHIWKKTVKKIAEKTIQTRFIVTDVSEESKKSLKEYKKTYHGIKYRFMAGFYLAPIILGSNRTLLLNFKDISVIVIKSSTITDQFRFFFNSLWKQATSKQT